MEILKEPAGGARIGVRYCGGCNPTYDRVAVVKRLQKLLPEYTFTAAQPGTPYDAVLVVSGCPTACTGTGDLAVPADRLIRIGGFADLLPTRDRLQSLLKREEEIHLNREQILSVLPHRPPMLFVDEVTSLVPGREISAQLYLDPEMEVFSGHFPGTPVFPGTLTIEAMAQAAGIMALTAEPERGGGRIPVLMEVGHARFLRKLQSGMTVQLHASLVDERKSLGVIISRCQALTDIGRETKLCAETEITLAIR